MLYSKDVVIQGFNGGIKTKGYQGNHSGNMADELSSKEKDKSKGNNKNKIFFSKKYKQKNINNSFLDLK